MCTKQPIQQAINYFLAFPNNYNIAKYRILDQKWAAIKDIKLVLSVSYEVSYKT